MGKESTVVDDEQDTEIQQSNGNGQRGMMIAMSSRQSQEVQASMMIAKRFPRDETAAIARITQACRRKKLAEVSQYVFPRGGTQVSGPSIRLAEVLSQSWGNIESGVVELERREGQSTAMVYCWDLETNTRDVKVFEVRHVRDTKRGPQRLTDERDIYEMVANVGARRKRACILAIIPGDVQELALAECDKTIEGDNKEPLIDRVRRLAIAFQDVGVSLEMIEKRLQHKIDRTVYQEFSALYKIYQSVKDGMAGREQFFETAPAAKGTTTIDDLDPDQKASEPNDQTEPKQQDQPKKPNGKAPEKYGDKSDAWPRFQELLAKVGNNAMLKIKEDIGCLNTPVAKLSNTQLITITAEMMNLSKSPAPDNEDADVKNEND